MFLKGNVNLSPGLLFLKTLPSGNFSKSIPQIFLNFPPFFSTSYSEILTISIMIVVSTSVKTFNGLIKYSQSTFFAMGSSCNFKIPFSHTTTLFPGIQILPHPDSIILFISIKCFSYQFIIFRF